MNADNPWKTLSQAEIYANPWISLTEHSVLNPSGNPGVYGVVHFKNRALGVIPLDEDQNITLVGQFRFPLNAYSWEIPEGGGPIDQDPLENAKRELLEETGLKASQWQELLRMHLSNSVSDELAIIYLARGLTLHESAPEETEQLEIKKIPFDQAYELVCSGVITDSLTVAAILKLKLLLSSSR